MLKRRGLQKQNSITKYIGCTPKELAEWIESQWEKGMNWESHGLFGWHIDHVIPISRFDLSNEEHISVAMNWMNLRPLWSTENIEKGDRAAQFIMPALREMADKIGVSANVDL